MMLLTALLVNLITAHLVIVDRDHATISPMLLGEYGRECDAFIYLEETSDLTITCKNSVGYQFAVRATMGNKPTIFTKLISETAVKARLDSPFRIRNLSNTNVLMLRSETLSVRNWSNGSLNNEIATRGGNGIKDVNIVHLKYKNYIIACDSSSIKMSQYELQNNKGSHISAFNNRWDIIYNPRSAPATALAVSDDGFIAFDDGGMIVVINIASPHTIFASFSIPYTTLRDRKLNLLYKNGMLLVTGASSIGFRAFKVNKSQLLELGTAVLNSVEMVFMDVVMDHVILSTSISTLQCDLKTFKVTTFDICHPESTPGPVIALSNNWMAAICHDTTTTVQSVLVGSNLGSEIPNNNNKANSDTERILLVVIAVLSLVILCCCSLPILLIRSYRREKLRQKSQTTITDSNECSLIPHEEMRTIYMGDGNTSSHMIPWEPFLRTKKPVDPNIQSGIYSAIRYRKEPVTLIPYHFASDNEHVIISQLNDEVACLTKLSHESIVSVMGWSNSRPGSVDITPHHIYIVSENCMQGSLLDFHQTGSRELTCYKLKPIINALSFLHELGIAHNAVCSRNILPTKSGDMKLILLPGVSVYFETRIQLPEQYVPWCSPECIDEQISKPDNDIYSFGCLLFEVLTGSKPPPPVGFQQTVASTNPSRMALWKLIGQCCSHNPNSRPVIEDLSEALSPSSVQSDKLSIVERSIDYNDEFDDGFNDTGYSYYKDSEVGELDDVK